MDICLKTLGCRLNEAELESWAIKLQQAGHTVSRRNGRADLVIINTCAVTREAMRKSRRAIRRLKADNPGAGTIVSGCYATLAAKTGLPTPEADLLVTNHDKDRLTDILKQHPNLNRPVQPDRPVSGNALSSLGRNRAFIKVQDGCRYRCSFCIVTIARGEERSRPLRDIIMDINHACEQGIREAVLTGVHLGGYGSDIDSDLTGLLKTILAETDIPRLRLGSLEPWDLGEDFLELFRNKRMMPHLHLPLQSGSDGVLRRMRRRCRTRDYEQLVAGARRVIPDFNLTTDIIVGFPGETATEWQESLAFIASTGFSHIHIFPYSPQTGTRAAALPEQVDPAEKSARIRQLQTLAKKMKKDFAARFTGRIFPVLSELSTPQHGGKTGYLSGRLPNYLPVTIRAEDPGSLQNRILPVQTGRYNESEQTLSARPLK